MILNQKAKTLLWVFGLLATGFLLLLAELAFVRGWANTPFNLVAVLTLLVLVFLLRSLSPALERVPDRYFSLGVLAVFLASRLAWLALVPTQPVSDFQYYFSTACDVASGRGMTDPVVLFQNGWGYQLFLGFIFRFTGCSLAAAKAVNLILGLATLPVFSSLAGRFGGKMVGRWSTLLFLVWPVQLTYTSVLGTEHLALPLALLGFWFGVKLLDRESHPWRNVALCTLFLTLGVLVRPSILVFLGAVGLALLLQTRPLTRHLGLAAVLVGGFLLINQAYTLGLKTFNKGIVPSPSYSLAANLFYGASYPALGMWSPEDFEVINSWPKADALRLSLQATWERVGKYSPRKIASLIYHKNYEFWGAPYYGWAWSTSMLDLPFKDSSLAGIRLDAWPYLFQLFVVAGALLAMISMLFTTGSARLGALLGVILFGTLMHLVFVVSSRYSYPFTPALLILAGMHLAPNREPRAAQAQSPAKSIEEYNAQRREHWDQVAADAGRWQPWNRYYHRRLAEIYRFFIPPGLRLLEVGCGQGDLLAALKPAYGVGVDLSPAMLETAALRYPHLHFRQADAHQLALGETFDVIILSDLIDDLWDVETVLRCIHQHTTPRTRLVLNYYSRIWAPLFALTEALGLSTPKLAQNWLVVEDVANLLYLTHFEVLRQQREVLWPLPVRPLDIFLNRFLVKLWPFSLLALTNFTVARPLPAASSLTLEPSVSVVVPARNEAGNIQQIVQRLPRLGSRTELVFIEGHSTDDTYATIQQVIAGAGRPCQLAKQPGQGKADAVRLGFSLAQGDILMILDADLTVAPEDLPKFYAALLDRKGELVNGVRLVYPMEKEAMRFLNFMGNKFFSLAFSWLLGQPVKDTLCGTKVLWKEDYDLIAANRAYFGDFDPFGDFDLLFGAARLNRKIVDLPIRYRERTYGTTNIQRWKHGWLLLRMVAFAALRIKFI